MKLKKIVKLFLIVFFVSCTKEYPKIAFETKTIDIGKLKRDTIIDVFFKPRNIGKSNLIIERITSECHCTVAKDFQKNIEPDQEGKIKISYDSNKGFGYFEQLIEVFSNAENSPSLLILTGRVQVPTNE